MLESVRAAMHAGWAGPGGREETRPMLGKLEIRVLLFLHSPPHILIRARIEEVSKTKYCLRPSCWDSLAASGKMIERRRRGGRKEGRKEGRRKKVKVGFCLRMRCLGFADLRPQFAVASATTRTVYYLGAAHGNPASSRLLAAEYTERIGPNYNLQKR